MEDGNYRRSWEQGRDARNREMPRVPPEQMSSGEKLHWLRGYDVMPFDGDEPRIRPTVADRLIMECLSPQERLQWLQQRLELCINLTPTGLEREAMTEANIRVMVGQEELSGEASRCG
jgi:hypothetical protein